MSRICTLCDEPINEGDRWGTITHSGPLGLFKEEDIGLVHEGCYEDIFGDEEEEDEDEDWEDEDDE